MLIKGKNIIGKKVLVIDQGKRVDQVNDIIFDPKEQMVKALLINPGGLFADAKVIPIEDVRSFGKDDVMIQSRTAIKKAPGIGDSIGKILKGEAYLTKAKLVTEEGVELGQVTDIYFDSQTGKAEELEVSQGVFRDIGEGKKTIRVCDVITVGEDAVIVTGYTEKDIEEQGKDQEIQKAVPDEKNQPTALPASFSDRLNQKGEKIRQDVQNLVDNLSELPEDQKTQNDLDELRNRAKDMIIKTEEQVNNFEKKLRDKFEDIKNDPDIQKTLKTLKDRADELRSELSKNVDELQSQTHSRITEVKTDVVERRKKDVVGKYLTKNIILPSDEIIAKRSDLITNKLIDIAAKNGLLDQVLDNSSPAPALG